MSQRLQREIERVQGEIKKIKYYMKTNYLN